MTIQIRTAVDGEETAVLSFYERLIDKMKGSPYPLRWEKSVYPTYADNRAHPGFHPPWCALRVIFVYSWVIFSYAETERERVARVKALCLERGYVRQDSRIRRPGEPE